MLIRHIRPEDDEGVASIIRGVMTEFGAVGDGFSIRDPEVDAMHAAYASEKAKFYVVEQRQELVGCGGIAQLSGAAPEVCELRKMYFLPQARGQGVGQLLAETLLQDAARVGFRTVYLETMESMEAANRLYQKLGFTRLGGRLGDTGHCGCDAYYALEVKPIELDPALLI